MTVQIPFACQGCKKKPAEVEQCNIRIYQFAANLRKCPKETGFEPTTPSIPVVKEEPIPEDEAAYLRPTYEKLGALLPVLRAPDGDVIDGIHRLKVDPAWYQQILTGINDPVKKAMARLVINVVRRQVPAEEKRQMLSEIAKLTGWSPQQIAESLGMSYTWVMKYLPDEFKQRPGVGPSEYPVTRRVTQPEAPIPSPASPELPASREAALYGAEPGTREARRAEQPEVSSEVTEAVPPSYGEPKPEAIDIGEFECTECHIKFHVEHIAPNLHRLKKVGKL